MARVLATLTGALALLSLKDVLVLGMDLGEDMDSPAELLSLEQLNRIHTKCDQNKDGKASLPELMQFGESVRRRIAEKEIDTVMNEIDVSPHDGHASLQEYMDDLEKHVNDEDTAAVNQHVELRSTELEKFKLADVDEDGSLNRNELINMVSPGMNDKIFEISTLSELRQKDSNNDGVLSEEEFWGDHVGQEGEFEKLDKNGDGVIDLGELKLWASGWYHTEAALKQLFDLADADKDGFLTTAELESVYTTIDTTDAHYHLLQWADNDGEFPESFMEFEEEIPLIEESEGKDGEL